MAAEEKPVVTVLAPSTAAGARAAALLRDGGFEVIVSGPDEYRRVGPVVLSGRERQVLRLAVEGLTNDSIARHLYISRSTVKSHLTSAFAKLSVRSRNEAATVLLNPEEPASHLVFGQGTGPALAVSGGGGR